MGAVGATPTHIDDILGRGGPDLFLKARCFSGERFGRLEARERSLLHVGTELAKEKDYTATLTQGNFAKNAKPLPTSPGLRAGQETPLSMGDTKWRQC